MKSGKNADFTGKIDAGFTDMHYTLVTLVERVAHDGYVRIYQTGSVI